MISLLLELGADPLAVDGSGQPVAAYATERDTDRRVMERIRAMTSAELTSAVRGHRPPRGGPMDLLALLALGEQETAEQMLRENAALIEPSAGVLHLMAKRNDAAAVKWLLDHVSRRYCRILRLRTLFAGSAGGLEQMPDHSRLSC